jgi:hypothetical protein
MSSYNAINGVPANVNSWLLQDVLRGDWGFEGFVTSDCDAIAQTVTKHHFVKTQEEAAALSVRSGNDQDCGGNEYAHYLPKALYELHLITEADLDIAARRTFETRLLYGEFDSPGACPFDAIPAAVINSKQTQELARQVEREAIVLLKNEKSLLPLSKNLASLAVIGPYSDEIFLGGYSNKKPFYKTPALDALEARLKGTRVRSAPGCRMDGTATDDMIKEAAETARQCDTVILILGTNNKFSEENTDAVDLDPPGRQNDLAMAVLAANPKCVVVLNSGNPMSINAIAAKAPAIVEAWHGGQEYGNALADVLLGDYNPAGRVAQTYYRDSRLLPAMDDYGIINKRLYMFADPKNVLFPFGHGLSYSAFSYSNLRAVKKEMRSYETQSVSVDVKNTGSRAGDEVVQMYLARQGNGSVRLPKTALKGFRRVALEPGETKTVTLKLEGMDGAYYSTAHKRFEVESGDFEIRIGASSADIRERTLVRIDWSVPPYPGFYKIVNKKTGLALQVDEGKDALSAAVFGPYLGYNSQKWTLSQLGNNAFRVANLKSGMELADGKGLAVTGGKVLNLPGEVSCVLERVIDSTAVALPPDWVKESKVLLRSVSTGLVVSARNNGLVLAANRVTPTADELFYVYELKNGKIALKSGVNSKFAGLDARAKVLKADRGKAGATELFERVKLAGGREAIRSPGTGEVFAAEAFPWTPEERNWKATASVNAEAGPLAFDLEDSTRWDTKGFQKPGMWFEVDFGKTEDLKGVVLDCAGSPGDYPRGYKVEVSSNGKDWKLAVEAEPGKVVQIKGVTNISFGATALRYMKITQTGSDPGCYWSIHDLRPVRVEGVKP